MRAIEKLIAAETRRGIRRKPLPVFDDSEIAENSKLKINSGTRNGNVVRVTKTAKKIASLR